jgi:serine protease AprX
MKTATILLKREGQEKIKNKVTRILENYDNFVLVEVTDEQIRSLLKEEFKVVVRSEIENIQLGTVTINTTQPRYDERGIWSHSAYGHIKDPGKGKHHYIVQFIGPIKDEWKTRIQEVGGVLGDPFPSYSIIVEMDEKSREKVRTLSFVRWIGHYDPSFRISSGLLKELEERETEDREAKVTHTVEKAITSPRSKIITPSEIATPIPNKFSISFHTKENLKAAIPEIKKLGGDIVGESGNSITCNLPQENLTEKIKELVSIHGVKLIDTIKMRKLRNDIATKIMCDLELSSSFNIPLSGKGEIVGVADTGFDTDDPSKMHKDFEDRIIGIRSWPISPEYNDIVQFPGDDDGPADKWSGHGTHVSGSVLGDGKMSQGLIRGLAVKAKLFFQALEQPMIWTNEYLQWYRRKYMQNPPSYELAGIPQNLNYLFQQAYDAGAKIHTNSWGGGYDGVYDEFSADIDRFVWEHKDMVILFAAGNDGEDKNRDGKIDSMSITPPGTAKNCICVGASENLRTSGGLNPDGPCDTYGSCWNDPSSIVPFPSNPIKDDRISDDVSDIVAFSSRGPCIDNRFKPDIVAPGTNILSTRSSKAKKQGWGLLPWNDPKKQFYMYMGGTSMATPLTAGAVALIRQYLRQQGLNPSASLVKAALINSALRLPFRYSVDTNTSNLWDFEQGWGHVNLKPFISEIDGFRMEFNDVEGLRTGEQKEYLFTVINSHFPFKVTLVYTDYPASPEKYPSIINNLNLFVTTPDDKDYHGNQFSPPYDSAFDSNNNVETVYIQNPESGIYKVTVLASDVSAGPQDFSLVISGGLKIKNHKDTGRITGKVVNRITNESLEEAKVSTDTGQSSKTDAYGTYELSDVNIGERLITVSKSGCKEASTTVTVKKDEVVITPTFELYCTQINIIGLVRDKSSKESVGNAMVSTNTGQSTKTDADGNYELSEVPVGECSITAFKDGCKCACTIVTVEESKVVTAETLELFCEEVIVPDVVKKTLAEAEDTLKNARLKVGKVTKKVSPEILPDTVLEQNPASGTKVPIGFPVTLVIATDGREKPIIPNVVRMTLAEAKDVLKKTDLSLTTWHRRVSTEPLCTVLAQEPKAGTPVSEGCSVRLWVTVPENDPSVRC